jgi:glycine cleavage system protein P-like pyridoxal-binding family
MYELQEMLREITGMQAVSLTPMAGAQGEFAGVAMIRAYHRARNDPARNEIIVPQAAHGTNPATAAMCGCSVKEIPCDANGDVDIDALKAAVGPATAAIMLTNPSTLGVFEYKIAEVARIVHEAGGLLYYDGANLNAILGKVRPGDMGFDVIHMNLHKTFSRRWKGGRAVPLVDGARPAAIHRPAVGLHGQCRGQSSRLHLHAAVGARGDGTRRGVRNAQCQLLDEKAAGGRVRSGLSRPAGQP